MVTANNEAALLDLGSIQGNILQGHHTGRANYLFFGVTDSAAGREFLAELIPLLDRATPSDMPKGADTELTVNVAITSEGLIALGVDAEVVGELPTAFTEPMAQRASRLLDDIGRSDPAGWDPGLGDGTAHLLVVVGLVVDPSNAVPDAHDREAVLAEHADTLAAQVATINGLADVHGLVSVHVEEAVALHNRREHFGWADGLGQPSIDLPGIDDEYHGGSPVSPKMQEAGGLGPWRPIALGEFIHGFPDEDQLVTAGPTAALLRNGTYMVFRKLFQDVGGFREQLQADAMAYCASQGIEDPTPEDAYELMAAKVVGRWRDGVPVELAPDRYPTGYLGDEAIGNPSNDFRYLEIPEGANEPDPAIPQGLNCPVGAHIRRTNPRDALGWHGNGEMSERHRIIRRGMPYGKPREGPKDDYSCDGVDRGLLFVCFNADIERQFEVVQRQWSNDGNLFALGNEKDYVLGDHLPPGPFGSDGRAYDGRMTIQTASGCPHVTDAHAPCVWTKGSEYLLMPGIDALEDLAAGGFSTARNEDEATAIARVAELAEQELASLYPGDTRPVGRDQHARAHGLVRARFTIAEDLPQALRAGLFGQPGHVYDAWIRFSSRKSGPGPSGGGRDAHGLSIKVLGVSGRKVLPQEVDEPTQDFVLANSPAFFCRNAVDYVKLAEAMADGNLLRFLAPRPPFEIRWREAVNLARAVTQKVRSPLKIRYWSQTPSKLGDHVVKWSARPTGSLPHGDTTSRGPDHLAQTMQRQLATGSATFDFQVQLQTDPVAMPLEDPTIRWSEHASPFVTLATIEIPTQQFQTEARRILAEDLSFTPWHSLPAHTPLGSINVVRRVVYETISRIRHDRNGVPRAEPTSLDRLQE